MHGCQQDDCHLKCVVGGDVICGLSHMNTQTHTHTHTCTTYIIIRFSYILSGVIESGCTGGTGEGSFLTSPTFLWTWLTCLTRDVYFATFSVSPPSFVVSHMIAWVLCVWFGRNHQGEWCHSFWTLHQKQVAGAAFDGRWRLSIWNRKSSLQLNSDMEGGETPALWSDISPWVRPTEPQQEAVIMLLPLHAYRLGFTTLISHTLSCLIATSLQWWDGVCTHDTQRYLVIDKKKKKKPSIWEVAPLKADPKCSNSF